MTLSQNFQIYLTESLLLLKKKCYRRNQDIRDSIEIALEDLKHSIKADSFTMKQFQPFKMACMSRNTSLISCSLNCLQKLISTSNFPTPFDNTSELSSESSSEDEQYSAVLEDIVATTCNCGINPDEDILLKVARNLIILVTTTYDIHGKELVSVIRTCFHILLSANSEKIRSCARLTISQIITIIFERSQKITKLFISLMKAQSDSTNEKFSLSEDFIIDTEDTENIILDSKNRSINFCKEIVHDIVRCNVLHKIPGKYGFCVVCQKPSEHYCIQTKATVCGIECKIRNLRKVISITSPDKEKSHLLKIALMAIYYQNDSLILFRSLCSLASRDSKGILYINPAESKPINIQSKEIALDLILHILKQNGSHLKKSKIFLSYIKENLIGCIMNNIFIRLNTISGVAICIFLELLRNFKTNLKAEIGVFLECVFGKIICSKNSTFTQKLSGVLVFVKICRNEQLIVDTFLNYDCNSDSFSCFEKIAEILEMLIQQKLVIRDWISEPQEQQLKGMAIICFHSLYESMVQWIKGDGTKSEMANGKLSAMNGFDSKYNEKKERENQVQNAILKFNENPKLGIIMLNSLKCMGDGGDDAIAKFLFETPSLSKRALGKYIGDMENASILTAFTFTFDFSNTDFDIAIRNFLSTFYLPGEGQIIDRIMHKFATKYCYDNPDTFKNSDSAHLLAFSIIMLNTDLHSHRITNKMTMEDFIKNNQSVIDDGYANADYLKVIYSRISKSEIRVEPVNQSLSDKISKYIPPKSRENLFTQEEESIKKEVQKIVKSSSNETGADNKKSNSLFVNTPRENVEIIQRMFELAWPSSLACISVMLEKSDDERIVSICLDIYKLAIKIATHFKMKTVKEAFINTLAQLTLLGTSKEMKPKNLKAVQTILEVAYTEAAYIGESWGVILKCISQIEYLHLIGSGRKPDRVHLIARHPSDIKIQQILYADSPISMYLNNEMDALPQEEPGFNAKAIAYLIDRSLIERIYSNSALLDTQNFILFMQHSVIIADEELSLEKDPRVFSLQKITETCHHNLNRPLSSWNFILPSLLKLFTTHGSSHNTNIANFSLSTLRGLCCKLFSIPKFSSAPSFQTSILSPFHTIARESTCFSVREFIIQCLYQIIKSTGKNLSDGWLVILSALKQISLDSREKLLFWTLELAYFSASYARTDKIAHKSLKVLNGILSSPFNVYKSVCLELILFHLTGKHTTQKIRQEEFAILSREMCSQNNSIAIRNKIIFILLTSILVSGEENYFLGLLLKDFEVVECEVWSRTTLPSFLKGLLRVVEIKKRKIKEKTLQQFQALLNNLMDSEMEAVRDSAANCMAAYNKLRAKK